MLETIGEVFPESKYQRCIVHFYRNVFSVVPRGKVREVAMMLKAIHAQESKSAARQKAAQVVQNLREAQLKAAAQKVEASIEETLTFMDFPSQHWTRIRTNNTLERLEHFQEKLRLVPTGKKPTFGILRGDSIQRSFDRCIQFFRCPGFDPAQDRFHFAPHFLYRIEVRAVYWEIFQHGSASCDHFRYSCALVGGKVIQDDDISRAQAGTQHFFHIDLEHGTARAPFVDHARRLGVCSERG